MDLSQLETPCLILDKGKLEKNIKKMHEHLARRGVPLRLHVKTAKCMEAVKMALEGQVKSITVSTLKEAEYFFKEGIQDILYAVGIAPVKLTHVAGLRAKGADIKIILDSTEQAQAVVTKGQELGITFPVLIEIDSDGHRAGVAPDDPLLIEIGRFLHHEKGAELKGVMTHAGAAYDCGTTTEIRKVAAQEREAAVKCAGRLRQAGLPCPIISIGSTPTAWFAEDFSGITEVRAGVYLFQDLVIAGLNVCKVEDIAVSVLASVIGHQKQKGWVLIDAGWMALSRDRGTAHQAVDQGYGLVCRLDGRPLNDFIVSATNQEHGIIIKRGGRGLDFKDFPIGSFVRILPNHACATAAMFDRYQVVNGTTEIIDTWQRINGW
jgi:D-serine deaminase-like pyridoxal phosphate-dependent protein